MLTLYLIQHHVDPGAGVAVIDRFTFSALEFLSKAVKSNMVTSSLADFADSWDTNFLLSRPVLDTHRVHKLPAQISLSEFFSSRQAVVYPEPVKLAPIVDGNDKRISRPAWAHYNPRLLIDRMSDTIRPAIILTKILI